MRFVLLVGTGSFIGGVLRYFLSTLVQNRYLTTYPIGTLTVNILGSFLIGLIFGLSERSNISMEWRLFLATGILGGFTTFSSFSNETIGLIREGQYWLAGSYVTFSVVLGLLATFSGLTLVKFL
jgi:fluoride exporter